MNITAVLPTSLRQHRRNPCRTPVWSPALNQIKISRSQNPSAWKLLQEWDLSAFPALLTEATWAEYSHTEFLPQAQSGIFRQETRSCCQWKNSLAVRCCLPQLHSQNTTEFPPLTSLIDILRMRTRAAAMGENPNQISPGKKTGEKTRTTFCQENIKKKKKINPRAQTLANSTPAALSLH